MKNMKKVLCVAAVLALVAGAYAADGRLVVTKLTDGYGLATPANALTPTASTVDIDNNDYNAYDYNYGAGPYVPGAYPPAAAPSFYGTVNPGDILYMWYQFDAAIAKGRIINGLEIAVQFGGSPVAGLNNAFYLFNDMQAEGGKRWNGTATAPNYPELAGNNPQVLVAVTSTGIVKAGAADPSNGWSGITAGSWSLLGAFVAPQTVGLYTVDALQVNYSNGPNPGNATSGSFEVIPEPASMLLLGLAGLLLRRR
jgi:hypothetical protein